MSHFLWLNIQELAASNSHHAQQLFHLINAQLSQAEREYSTDGQVVIKIVREHVPKTPKDCASLKFTIFI